MNEIIHIGYGDSAAGCLRAAIKLGMPGDKVVVSRDDFTQGPISDCIADGGLTQRSQYWSSLKTLHAQLDDVYEHYTSSLRGLEDIAEGATVILWVGDSAHDQLATAWLCTYLQNKNLEWFQIDLKELSENQEDKLINLAILTPDQVAEEYNRVKPISAESLNDYKQLWQQVATENSQYRIQKEDQIISVTEDFHDEYILSRITKKEQFLGKLMGNIMGFSEQKLSDTTIESRLVALQYQKKVKIELSLVNVFLSKVKLK